MKASDYCYECLQKLANQAGELSKQIKVEDDNFRSCLQFAALGNTIDFFRPLDVIRQDIKEPVNFVIDDSGRFKTKLKQATRILYLADNAGEVFFAKPFTHWK